MRNIEFNILSEYEDGRVHASNDCSSCLISDYYEVMNV